MKANNEVQVNTTSTPHTVAVIVRKQKTPVALITNRASVRQAVSFYYTLIVVVFPLSEVLFVPWLQV